MLCNSVFVLSVVPGTSGWWKCMSCSPWTMNPNASGGMTSATAAPMAAQVGTTPNTGGAYFPDEYASLSSFVAAAYALARSPSIVPACGPVMVPILLTSRAMGDLSLLGHAR